MRRNHPWKKFRIRMTLEEKSIKDYNGIRKLSRVNLSTRVPTLIDRVDRKELLFVQE